MARRSPGVVTVIPALCALLLACSGSEPRPVAARLQALLDQTRAQCDLPGLALAVFSGDSVYFAGVSGVKRLGTNDSLAVTDKFHLGSNTKAMVAFAAASLVEKGVIGWETKFFELCPDLQGVAREEYYDITLRQLLRHEAGLVSKEAESDEILMPSISSESPIDRRALFAWALDRERYSGGYQYSNTGYVMAAHMLEQVTGHGWQDILQELVFQPLKIQGAFGWPAADEAGQPWGHYLDPETGALAPHDPHHTFCLRKISLDPAGDVSMALGDYTRFLQDSLRGYNGHDAVLAHESYRLMHSGEPYALGWATVSTIDGRTNVSTHTGSAGTFHSMAFLFKDDDLGIAILSNSYAMHRLQQLQSAAVEAARIVRSW
jgi:CubicO group peptidase (beta-lactamase class C family)